MNIAQAILYLYPDSDPMKDFIVIKSLDEQKITYWGLNQPIPNQNELEDAWQAFRAKEDINEKESLRKDKLPSISEQLDAIWKGGDDMEVMRERIRGINEQYGKN